MRNTTKTAIALATLLAATQAAAQVTFYEREDFRGRSFATDRQVRNMERAGYNDRASSAIVDGGRWQVCEDAGYTGRCVVLQPGRYASLQEMGLDNEISSVRAFEGRAAYEGRGMRDGDRHALAGADYAYGTREGEALYEARVTSVRAVVGAPEQRCWVERQQVAAPPRSSSANVGGAIAGAVIGGILGHQVGSGRGNDIATAGGAVAGAAIGANVNRGDSPQDVYAQDVQRCAATPTNAQPAFWDVTYSFRGMEHRVQTQAAPGPTITVNDRGEPRE